MASRKPSAGLSHPEGDPQEEVVSEVTDVSQGRSPAPALQLDEDELPELSAASGMRTVEDLDDAPMPSDEELDAASPEELPPEDPPVVEEDAEPLHSRTQTKVASPEDERPLDPEAEDRDVTRAGSPILLEVIDGPDVGKSKRFNRVRMVIGRAEGCEFRLGDQAVSRRHVELVQGEKGVLLRDLSSGNPCKVNDEPVLEVLLGDGDRIAIGKTVIRFVDEVAAFSKLREEAKEREEAEDGEEAKESESAAEGGTSEDGPEAPGPVGAVRPQERRSVAWTLSQKLVLAGLGVICLLVVLLVLLTRDWSPPAPDPQEVARGRMELALIAVRAQKFEEAIRLVQEAEKLVPGIDSEHLLERATNELEAMRAVRAAQIELERGQFDRARAALLSFPKTASDARLQERDRLVAEIASKEVGFWRTEAERLLRLGDLEGGRALFEKLPPEEQAQLSALLIAVEEEVRAQQRKILAREAQQKVARLQKLSAERQAEIDAAFAVVARKFHAGEYRRAAAECDRVVDQHRGDAQIRARAKQLQALIPTFGRNFEEGTRKYKANQLSLAVRPLRRAKELYAKIGFPGAIGQQIDEQLASAVYALARDALAREDYVTAAKGFREAARLDSADQRSRDGLERIATKAQELYEAAYMARDRNPREAIARLKVVLQITSPGTEVHEKAKMQLSSLSP